MHVGVIGSGRRAAGRAALLEALPGVRGVARCEGGSPEAVAAFAETVDAVFVAVPTGEVFGVAGALARRGMPMFLEWPPAVSVREGEALVRLVEEAGVEIAVSRPLRAHGLFGRIPEGWRPALVVVRHDVARAEAAGVAARARLADAVDLCCALAGSTSVQRIDAEAARGASLLPEAVAFGLRYHNGAYAQVALTGGADAESATLYASGGGHHLRADLRAGRAEAAVDETTAFLQAIRTGRSPAVTALDALHTLRLVERLMARLR